MRILRAAKATVLLLWFSIVLVVSLFMGLMIATAGGALYTPVYKVAAPFACDGRFTIESRSFSYKPGQSGVAHTVYCEDPATGVRTDITSHTLFVAFLVYSGLTFLVLLFFTPLLIPLFRLSRNILKATTEADASSSAFSTGTRTASMSSRIVLNGREYACPDEMPEAERAVYERVTSMFVDSDHDGVPDLFEGVEPEARADGDVAHRLKKLKELLDLGLITRYEYEAKKKEILGEL